MHFYFFKSTNEKDSISDIFRLSLDSEIRKRWDNFCSKVLKYEIDFTNVINVIIDFISPPFESIVQEDEFFGNWDSKERKYNN